MVLLSSWRRGFALCVCCCLSVAIVFQQLSSSCFVSRCLCVVVVFAVSWDCPQVMGVAGARGFGGYYSARGRQFVRRRLRFHLRLGATFHLIKVWCSSGLQRVLAMWRHPPAYAVRNGFPPSVSLLQRWAVHLFTSVLRRKRWRLRDTGCILATSNRKKNPTGAVQFP